MCVCVCGVFKGAVFGVFSTPPIFGVSFLDTHTHTHPEQTGDRNFLRQGYPVLQGEPSLVSQALADLAFLLDRKERLGQGFLLDFASRHLSKISGSFGSSFKRQHKAAPESQR